MQARGHNVTWIAPGQSTAQSLRVLSNGTFEAAGKLETPLACEICTDDGIRQSSGEPRQLNSGGYAV